MSKHTIIDRDWNNREVEFVVGDRVTYYADDVTTFKGTILARIPGLLHISFDNGDKSWQNARYCELCNFG